MKFKAVLFFALLVTVSSAAYGQRHEVSAQAGVAHFPTDLSFEFGGPQFSLRVKDAFAFQVGYAYRFLGNEAAAIYLDVPLSVVPQAKFETANTFFVKGYRSVFLTPGLKVKLFPKAPVSPYAVAGAGIVRLTPSDELINGQPAGLPNQPLDSETDNAYSFGGGVDVRLTHSFSLRGEVRNFRAATPEFSENLFVERQNNIFVTGGVVFRF